MDARSTLGVSVQLVTCLHACRLQVCVQNSTASRRRARRQTATTVPTTVLRVWVPPTEAMPPNTNLTAVSAALSLRTAGVLTGVTAVITVGRALPTFSSINFTRFPAWNDVGEAPASNCTTDAGCEVAETCSPQWPPDPRDNYLR